MEIGEFESAYRRHAAAVLGYARRCVGRQDVAEELASDAFVELLRNVDRITADQLPAWLYTVIRHRSIDYWRRQKLERAVLKEQDCEPAAEDSPPVWEILGHENLNAAHRICLTLRYVYGMAREEIAEFTGFRDAQVKGYLRYGLEILRRSHAEKREPGK